MLETCVLLADVKVHEHWQRTLSVGEKISVRLVSRVTVPTKQEKMLLFLCSETTDFKPVKQETSYTLTRPLMLSVLWY